MKLSFKTDENRGARKATILPEILFKNMLTPSGCFEKLAPHTEQNIHDKMRTKTLFLTAVLSGACVATSLAQVYSQNAVGYVNKSIPTGFSMIANPLDTSNNTIGSLIASPPLFANFYKWNGAGFDIATFGPGGWDLPNITLAPGEGGFINTDTAFTNTFVGEVKQGGPGTPNPTLANAIPVGFSIRASMVPQAGAIDVLGLTNLSLFDNVYKWNGTTYTIFTLGPGGWDPSTPTIDVGESIFINAQNANSWNRDFNVNQ